ncbi:MAG: Ig-like domain-containing protein, partial [Bacteroidota bacterium]
MRWILIILPIVFLASCANIIPPTGGPQDTIPPKLIQSLPPNGQTNFSGKTSQLEFNEDIQLKDAKEEIIITPTFGKETKFLFKKNIVLIEPSESLSKDVTYSIAFRQSIQDLNEGNPAEDLKLAFSTGQFIDSLSIYGKVTTAAEDKPAEKYTVAIYQSDTFNIYKHAPVYITRTAKNGTFSILNLKPGTYNAYAFADKNKNLKVDSQSEWFGTAPMPINLPEQKDSIRIPVIRIDTRPLKMNSSRGVSNYAVIRLNKAPATYTLKPTDKRIKLISHYGSNRSEITTYPPALFPDSTLVRLTAEDSVGQRIDTAFYIKQTKQKP